MDRLEVGLYLLLGVVDDPLIDLLELGFQDGAITVLDDGLIDGQLCAPFCAPEC